MTSDKLKLINHRDLLSFTFLCYTRSILQFYIFFCVASMRVIIIQTWRQGKTVAKNRKIQSVDGFIYNDHFFLHQERKMNKTDKR